MAPKPSRQSYLEQQVKLLPKNQQDDAKKLVTDAAKTKGGITKDKLVELDRKFNDLFKFDNSFILNLVITKYQVLNYVPEKFKDHLLINLFAINESITAKQYLHSSYKNNTVFCSLFD